jgi:Fe-S-cluster containining protein
MLTKDQILHALSAAETVSADAVLSLPRDRNTAVKLSVGAGQRAETRFLPLFERVACKAGCAFCCYGVQVHVTAPEVLALARGFRETLSAAQVAMVLERVKRHADTIRGMSLGERLRARTPCPLLDENSNYCSVHQARPMRCRAHHSLDVGDCEAAAFHPDESRSITRDPDVIDGHEAMISGQENALVAAGLDARSFELSLALEVALTHEDAAERWARGERLFDDADFFWPDS